MSLDKSLWNQWAVLPLRLIIGFGFMAHGWAKWSRGPEKFGELLHQIGLPFPGFTAWVVTFLEFFGGMAILAGILVALVSIPLVISMLGATFTVQLKYGFSSYQYDWPDENRPGIRTARLRNQPLIHRGTAPPGLEQPYAVIS